MNEAQRNFLLNEYEAQLASNISSRVFYHQGTEAGYCVVRADSFEDTNGNLIRKQVFTCSKRVADNLGLIQGSEISVKNFYTDALETYHIGPNLTDVFLSYECILE